MSVVGDVRKIIQSEPKHMLRTRNIVIPPAQVGALRATPKVLVPAKGSTSLIQFVSSVLEFVPGAVAWTEATANLVIRYTNGSGIIVSQTIEMTGFITAAVRSFTSIQPLVDGIVITSGALNRPLVLHNTGAAEFGGAGTGSLIVHLAYRVWDLG